MTIPSACGAASHPLSDRTDRDASAPAACPTPACSAAWRACRRSRALDRFLTWTHWLWFFEPYAVAGWILVRHHERFPRAARQMAAVFDLGCVVYFAVPTAPPWWSSEQGLTGEEVRRIMVEVGEPTWGRPGRGCTTRSAATPGRRCPRSTSPPRWPPPLAGRSGQGRGGGRLGLRGHARLRPRLPRRALRHRPDRRRGAGRRGANAASRWPTARSRGQRGLQRLERIASG